MGIVGGSGLYDLPGLHNARWERIDSAWGEVSDDILFAEIDGLPIRFLPRHGLAPSEINYRANIDALKRTGVTDLVSFSACGSLDERLAPGHFVLVDQFIDQTRDRPRSFFGNGCVAHVSMAEPVSPTLAGYVQQALEREAVAHTRGGTYVVIEGPQFSSRAESLLYRSWGCHVIGMTNMPEARLAREAELSYTTVAMVTDYDCWRENHAAVDVESVLAVMKDNTSRAQVVIQGLAAVFPRRHPPCSVGSDRALEGAIVTPPGHRDLELMQRLDTITGRVLGESLENND
nr:S-methyl-5'-thioadenosine phosphorylase [Natronocella acetinitrilica]